MIRLLLSMSMIGLVFLLGLSHPSTAYPQSEDSARVDTVPDPFEPFNQVMLTFNVQLDHYVLSPVATGYAFAVPGGARQGVDHFFHNIGVTPRIGNKLLQFELVGAGKEFSRFVINSTLGGLGFFDIAQRLFGIERSDADFGQTLAHYGVSSGAYLVLPFFGPTTLRDAIGFGVDGAMQPMNYLLPAFPEVMGARASGVGAGAINKRSMDLGLFESVDRYSLDLYGAVQDGYLQRREQMLR